MLCVGIEFTVSADAAVADHRHAANVAGAVVIVVDHNRAAVHPRGDMMLVPMTSVQCHATGSSVVARRSATAASAAAAGTVIRIGAAYRRVHCGRVAGAGHR